MDLASHSLEDGINARLVGINLKKPTANMVFLTNTAISVQNEEEACTEENVPSDPTDETEVEEEVVEDD